jgi:hypothetical protein
LTEFDSNSLQRALAEGDGSPHPDADVLTAYAEGTLLPRERETVFSHLACCTVCRNVVSVADVSAEASREEKPFLVAHRARPAWRVVIPSLAAAAAIAVVSTVAVRHALKPPPIENPTMATTNSMEEKATAPIQSAPQHPVEKKQLARKTAPVSPALAPMAESAPATARAGSESYEASNAESRRSASAGRAPEQQRMMPQGASQMSALANTARSRALANAAMISVPRAHWRINEEGQPERAFIEGQWQPVPPSDSARMRVLSESAGEVWVGGEKSEVFRSFDNGTSWRLVSLPEKNGTAHTIAHIRFDSAHEVTIEATDGTTWTTTDGGESWR